MPNNVVSACMLYVAANPMHGLVTPMYSKYITACLLEFWY